MSCVIAASQEKTKVIYSSKGLHSKVKNRARALPPPSSDLTESETPGSSSVSVPVRLPPGSLPKQKGKRVSFLDSPHSVESGNPGKDLPAKSVSSRWPTHCLESGHVANNSTWSCLVSCRALGLPLNLKNLGIWKDLFQSGKLVFLRNCKSQWKFKNQLEKETTIGVEKDQGKDAKWSGTVRKTKQTQKSHGKKWLLVQRHVFS